MSTKHKLIIISIASSRAAAKIKESFERKCFTCLHTCDTSVLSSIPECLKKHLCYVNDFLKAFIKTNPQLSNNGRCAFMFYRD